LVRPTIEERKADMPVPDDRQRIEVSRFRRKDCVGHVLRVNGDCKTEGVHFVMRIQITDCDVKRISRRQYGLVQEFVSDYKEGKSPVDGSSMDV
jgi:hypothetical protein